MDIDSLRQPCLDLITQAETVEALEQVRMRLFGKAGEVTQLLKSLGTMSPEGRKVQGERINTLKQELSDVLTKRLKDLKEQSLEEQLQKEWQDVTLPAFKQNTGHLHPITQAMEEMLEICRSLGFMIAEGPEIEDDYHNFTALNIPEEHPARQLMDTFYLEEERNGSSLVLRTHTSPVQIRALEKIKPPLRVATVGRVYRADYDQTHTPNFHQLEALVIEENIHMGHLKGCLMEFCRRFFGVEHLPLRFRPSFFPFTEPSAEIDILCSREDGKLTFGVGTDWLEILGSGMVHPKVLENCHLDPTRYQGFAFGIGIERAAMLKYGISDLRSFYEADLRWLRHYGFSLFEAAQAGSQAR